MTATREAPTEEQVDEVVRSEFHRRYYDAAKAGGTWAATRFLHVPVLKCPLDLWTYQEIVVETKPDLIVETGTCFGGSALYLATLCETIGRGRVVTIDVSGADEVPNRPQHPRIEYVTGSSTDPAIVARVHEAARGLRVLVILDSDHSRDHVLAEMRAYADLVPEGGYLIVEDTNVNGNPVFPDFGPGPMEAVVEFMRGPEGADFGIDRERDRKFMLSFNPFGYLRRRARGVES